jgi:hypothetical protein
MAENATMEEVLRGVPLPEINAKTKMTRPFKVSVQLKKMTIEPGTTTPLAGGNTSRSDADMVSDILRSFDKNTKKSIFLASVNIDQSYTRDQLIALLEHATYDQPNSMFSACTRDSGWGDWWFVENVNGWKIRSEIRAAWQ